MKCYNVESAVTKAANAAQFIRQERIVMSEHMHSDFKLEHGNFWGDSAEGQSFIVHLPRGTERLEELGTQITLPKNQIIIRAEDTSRYCYVVKSGKVVAYEFSPNGDERFYSINEPGSIILEDIVIFQKATPVSFKTASKVELIRIDRTSLIDAIAADPEISFDIIQSITMKFLGAMQRIRDNNTHGADWKISNLFLVFACNHGVPYDGRILIQEKISQQMMSSLLGINRITAVRAVKNLKDMGLIEQINGYYCIRDIEALRRHRRALEETGK